MQIDTAVLIKTLRFLLKSNKGKHFSRPVLNNVCLDVAGNRAVFVTTDGCRIARVVMGGDAGLLPLGEHVFPLTGAARVLKMLEHFGETTVLTVRGSAVVFSDGVRVEAIELDGARYPQYAQVVCNRPDSEVAAQPVGCNVAYLADACAALKIFDPKNKAVVVYSLPDAMVLRRDNPPGASGVEFVDVKISGLRL